MINQTAVFIDAGFLLAAGGRKVADTTLRGAVKVQYSTLIKGITKTVKFHSGMNNLRTYWYDASKDGLLTDEQKKIAMIPDVKVRLGRLNYYGEQKGVDLRLALDLVGLARTGAVSTAYLVSGDDDLTEAVEEAQSLGLKVVLLGVNDQTARLGYASLADHLAVTVDSIEALPEELLTASFTRAFESDLDRAQATNAIAQVALKPPTTSPTEGTSTSPSSTHPGETTTGPDTSSQSTPAQPAPKAPTPARMPSRTIQAPQPASASPAIVYSSSTADGANYQGASASEQELIDIARRVGAQVARSWYASTTQADLNEMIDDRPLLPPDIDRVLLKDCAQTIGEQDTNLQSVRRTLRSSFWEEIDNLQ